MSCVVNDAGHVDGVIQVLNSTICNSGQSIFSWTNLMKLDAFNYTLPSQMIASSPAEPREAARLLDLSVQFIDRQVGDLPSLLRAGDVLVVNNTEVIPARLEGRR